MKLTIAKIDEVLYQGEALSVSVPGAGGDMTVLAHHMPLITTLKKGNIIVRAEGESDRVFPVDSGFLEIGKEETVILL